MVTIDIPRAFLHANNEDYVIMKMIGTLVELMVKTNPKLHRKYVVIKKGCSVLYLWLQKALYGMMKSTLLFYRKLVTKLCNMGFEINPYDPCIANKTVNYDKPCQPRQHHGVGERDERYIWRESCRESQNGTRLLRNDIQLLF